MHLDLHTCPAERTVHLIEDVRFVRPVSGRRARRLVYAASPTPRVGVTVFNEARTSLFLAS